MTKLKLIFFAQLLLTSGAIFAQPISVPSGKVDAVPEIKGLNLVEGKDKKLHLMLDGKRIGSIQVDREWAKANFGFTPIPPGFREPHVTKHPTPRDPCIFAAAGGKCMPDVFKQEPIIRFPNDVREMGVLTRK